MSVNEVRKDQLPTGAGGGSTNAVIPAASVLLFRADPERFEVLMLRRSEKSGFVPGAWVFPGGAVDEVDRAAASSGEAEPLAPFQLCAIRELFEETGVWLAGAASPTELGTERRKLLGEPNHFLSLLARWPVDRASLVWTSRWITPEGVPKRFDTYFFLAIAPDGADPTPEGEEGVEARWIVPVDALEQHLRGELPMVFPTMKNLEAIARFSTAAELLDARRGQPIPTTRPILIIEGSSRRIILPEENE